MQNKGFCAPRVVIRPSLPADSADVLEFTKYTWDGDDYIAYIWHDWLEDPEGLMISAEFGGHTVGIAKLTRITNDQWWLQGLRVDPRFEDRGIGRLLNDYMNSYWLEHCSGKVRLLTSRKRQKVHHMCEQSGYTRLGELSYFVAPPLKETVGNFTPIQEADLIEVMGLIRSQDLHSYLWGLMDLGWKFAEPNVEVTTPCIREGKAYWWRDREGILMLWEDESDQSTLIPMISLLA